MDFPSFAPSSRQYTEGDYPVKSFKAMNGFEVRILYGSKLSGMKINLTYNALTDSQAEQFLYHFDSKRGTFESFYVPFSGGMKTGWQGSQASIDAIAKDSKWRYEAPPKITSVRPGRSNVSVSLVGVLTS